MWTEWTKWTKWTECSAAPFNNHTVRALACGCYRILLSLRRIFGPPLIDLSLSDLCFTQCPLWSGFAFDLVFDFLIFPLLIPFLCVEGFCLWLRHCRAASSALSAVHFKCSG